ncbi:MAG TPA: hypothetical protein VFR37_18675, partial [Longimicrobium sp.]|nr:hypothetical protein [Longimicrobium sp.]
PSATEVSTPAANTLVISDERAAVLTAAVDDARTRLLAGVGEGDGLQRALTQLSSALSSPDRAGLDHAIAQARAALDGLAAQQDLAVMAELDAIRLALDEVALSAAGPAGAELQH